MQHSYGPRRPGVTYWERQGDDRMCALHCLNSLLQGPYFDPSDLATVGADLDRKEMQIMAEMGEASEAYKKFVAEGSQNAADDGFFSVSVIEESLKKFDILCIPAYKPEMTASLDDPTIEEAFLCNLANHWFSIRKLDNKWYNLDSLKPAPLEISEFHLGAFLRSLPDKGYTVFVIRPNVLSIGRQLRSSSQPIPLVSDNIPPPGGFSFLQLPPPTDTLNPNQMYLTDADIAEMRKAAAEKEQEDMQEASRIAESDDPRNPTDNPIIGSWRSEQKVHVWPNSEGRRLVCTTERSATAPDSSSNPANSTGSASAGVASPGHTTETEGNDEISEAIKLSIQSYLESLPKAPPEPVVPPQEGMKVVQIRFPDGSRVVRRFAPDHVLKHIFIWLESEASIDPQTKQSIVEPPLSMLSTYFLQSGIGSQNRKRLCKVDNSFEVLLESGVVSDAGCITLDALGLEDQTMFHLQL